MQHLCIPFNKPGVLLEISYFFFFIKNDFEINDNGLISLYAEDNVKRETALMSFNISDSLMSTYSKCECV